METDRAEARARPAEGRCRDPMAAAVTTTRQPDLPMCFAMSPSVSAQSIFIFPQLPNGYISKPPPLARD